MWSKFFHHADTHICPKCGMVCALTAQVCPQCGSNLVELFERTSSHDPQASPSSDNQQAYVAIAGLLIIGVIVLTTLGCGTGFLLLPVSQGLIRASGIPASEVCFGVMTAPEIKFWVSWRSPSFFGFTQLRPNTLCRFIPRPAFVVPSGDYSVP